MDLIVANDQDRHIAQNRAFFNAIYSVDGNRSLPEQVYKNGWRKFKFFQSDYVFSPDFCDAAAELLRAEGAHSAALINIDKQHPTRREERSVVFFEPATLPQEYASVLFGSSPGSGWMFDYDRYVCASDVGGWAIYCERSNDVAIIAFREMGGVSKNVSTLAKVWNSIEPLMNNPGSPDPFCRLVDSWRRGLIENYGARVEKKDL